MRLRRRTAEVPDEGWFFPFKEQYRREPIGTDYAVQPGNEYRGNRVVKVIRIVPEGQRIPSTVSLPERIVTHLNFEVGQQKFVNDTRVLTPCGQILLAKATEPAALYETFSTQACLVSDGEVIIVAGLSGYESLTLPAKVKSMPAQPETPQFIPQSETPTRIAVPVRAASNDSAHPAAVAAVFLEALGGWVFVTPSEDFR
jgi:hypothetical protein